MIFQSMCAGLPRLSPQVYGEAFYCLDCDTASLLNRGTVSTCPNLALRFDSAIWLVNKGKRMGRPYTPNEAEERI